MSALIKDIQFDSGIVCSYWVISKFTINLDIRNIEVICKIYKDKQSFLDLRPPVETKVINVDTGYYDLATQNMKAGGFNPESMYYSILNSIELFGGTGQIELG